MLLILAALIVVPVIFVAGRILTRPDPDPTARETKRVVGETDAGDSRTDAVRRPSQPAASDVVPRPPTAAEPADALDAVATSRTERRLAAVR